MRLPNPFQIFLESEHVYLMAAGVSSKISTLSGIHTFYLCNLISILLPAVAIPKVRQINDLSAPILVLIMILCRL